MDQAVIAMARAENMEVHISTQINITNIETVKFYAMFADKVVLSRELSLRQVKKITEQIEKEEIKPCFSNLVSVWYIADLSIPSNSDKTCRLEISHLYSQRSVRPIFSAERFCAEW